MLVGFWFSDLERLHGQREVLVRNLEETGRPKDVTGKWNELNFPTIQGEGTQRLKRDIFKAFDFLYLRFEEA